MGNKNKKKKSSKHRKKSRGGINLDKKYRNLSKKPKKVKIIDGTKQVNEDLKISTKKSRKKVNQWVQTFKSQLNKSSNPRHSENPRIKLKESNKSMT